MKSRIKENYIIDRFERLRKEKGLTLYRVALLAGLSQSSLSNLINRRNTPNINTLDKLCSTLNITLAQFFSADDELPNLTKEQKQVLNLWSNLTNREKELAKAYIQGLIDG